MSPLLFEPPTPEIGSIETSLRRGGVSVVIGADEAGRGCLAGPLHAAAVALPAGLLLDGVDDSKALAEARREALFETVTAASTAWSIQTSPIEEIERLNILGASLAAMERAVREVLDRVLAEGTDPAEVRVVIDGPHHLRGHLPCRQMAAVKGDARSRAVAAASILAKVSRDRRMDELARLHPGYGWEQNKGYGTAAHLAAIKDLGLTPWHRPSFGPCKK